MSAQRFFITGLPRSRTAWLSTFFSTGNAICYHETIGMSDITELPSKFESDFYKYVGVCESSLGFFMEWILDNIKPKTMIVERDPNEVYASLVQMGVKSTRSQLQYLADELKKFRDHPLVMWVPFEALNVKRVVQRSFWHLMPGHAFDETRYDEMSKFNIEVIAARAFEDVKKYERESAKLFRNVRPLMEARKDEQIH